MSNDISHYTLAGWLAIISAVLVIPEIVMGVMAEIVSSDFNFIIFPIHLANTLISLFLLFTFKKLLNNQFKFYKINNLITVLIIASILFALIGMVGQGSKMIGMSHVIKDTTSLVTIVLFVPYSILMVVFGVQIQKMEDDLFGLLKPFAYATIGSGICGATIVLMPIGLVCGIVALVIEGMIFLRANREAEIL